MKTFTTTGGAGLDIAHIKGPKSKYTVTESNDTLTYDSGADADYYNKYIVTDMKYLIFANETEVNKWDDEIAPFASQPGDSAGNPIIIDAGVAFESQGAGITDYNLDFGAGAFYRVNFSDGYYVLINNDTNKTGFHGSNSTNFQAFNYDSDDTLKSQAWVGTADEVQYVTYNWEMSFSNVSGNTYKVSFERKAAVGGGGL